MSAPGLLNLNGNILCAIDVETTGERPRFHDIIQICVLPLDSNLKPMKGILPFYTEMKPLRPENHSIEAMGINRQRLCEVMQKGLDPFKAADLFDEWFQKLKLPYKKRISPLAQNWPFDREFIVDWLGPKTFSDLIDSRYRDTMTAALYMNDRAEFQVEQIPFPKVNLKYLCSQLKIVNERAHDALADCVATAEVYRRMVSM